MLKRSLLPITLSESQDSFLSSIKLLNRLGTKEFYLCHVIDSGFTKLAEIQERILQYHKLAAQALPQDNTVESEILSGHAASGIITFAEKIQAGYIYLPASQRRWLGKVLVGSIASDVVRLSTIPVFVHKVRPYISQDRGASKKETVEEGKSMIFRSVIAAKDFGPSTDRVCAAIKEMEEFCERIIFFHVGKRAGDPYMEAERRRYVVNKLHEIKGLYENEVECQEKHTIGLPSREILKEAKGTEADLIILGKSNVQPTPGEIILGSTAERVLNKSQASLLIIP